MTQAASTRDWREIYEKSRSNRIWFKRALVIYAFLDFLLIAESIRHGIAWLAAVGFLSASFLLVVLVGVLWEHESPLKRLDLRKQSWAFLGDLLGLMPMAIVAALAFSTLPANRWFNSGFAGGAWMFVALATGAVCSYSFRRGEGANFDVLRYFSYTKLLHNGVAFTVLAATIVYTMIPVLFAGVWSGGGYRPELYLSFLGLWLVGAMVDGYRGNLPQDHPWRLDGSNLHSQADEHGRIIHPDIPNVPTWAEFRKQDPNAAFGWTDVFIPAKLVRLLFAGRR